MFYALDEKDKNGSCFLNLDYDLEVIMEAYE